jgi:hypothetical protein
LEQVHTGDERACSGFGMVERRAVRPGKLDQQRGGLGIERPPILWRSRESLGGSRSGRDNGPLG